MDEASILRATMHDTMTVSRQSIENGVPVWSVIYRDWACALSRSAHSSAPAPPTHTQDLAEVQYRLSLFLPAGTYLRAGDKVEVCRDSQRFCGIASDSISYPSHSVCVLFVLEVLPL